MAFSTKTNGILQSDILIRTAILAAIEDIRANPWLLDYVFSWIQNDELTTQEYGDEEINNAKDWVLSNAIFVQMANDLTDPQLPLISIALKSSVEDMATIGDVHYNPQEDVDPTALGYQMDVLLGPFSPAQYDKSTGEVTLPENLNTSNVFVGAVLYDTRANIGYEILEITGDQTFKITDQIEANLTNAIIAPYDNFWTANMESCEFKETYELACMASGPQLNLNYLVSLTLFCLMRYKQEFLEKRGFERTVVSMGPLLPYPNIPGGNTGDVVYYRPITVTGIIRQYWPKYVGSKVQGIVIWGEDESGTAQSTITPGWVKLGYGNSKQGWVPSEENDWEDEAPF